MQIIDLSRFLSCPAYRSRFWATKRDSRPLFLLILFGVIGGSLPGCFSSNEPTLTEFKSPPSSIESAKDNVKQNKKQKWAFIGDSLTAGFGVASSESYVSILEKKLLGDFPNLELINAGVSGDTSAGVLRRLDWILKDRPQKVFLCIGANDGLRGLPLPTLEKNLNSIIDQIQTSGSQVILMGMMIPPNYGPKYTNDFKAIYPRIADQKEILFLPFLLEGVAGDSTLNQADGIHPNVQGHQKVAQHVFQFINTHLKHPPNPSKTSSSQGD